MSLVDALPEEQRRRARRLRQPDWMAPMLATLTEDRFSDPGWVYERKLDGVRCVAIRRAGGVQLFSRNRLRIDVHYPEVAEALAAQDVGGFVADGEIVAFGGSQSSFARLQRRMHVRDPEAARRTGVAVQLYLFDLPYVDGFDITAVGLLHRKALLRRLLRFGGPVRFSTHRRRNGEAYWREACDRRWEGVIAKRADSPYEHARSRSWLKFKCVNEQEFVIGGYTDPRGSRAGLGALLVGHYRGDRLVYAGKVGTGYSQQTLVDLVAALSPLERGTPPFDGGVLPRTGVHWVQPKLVAQIGFAEWTRDGQLRHPRFLGLRTDKRPREVVRE